MTLLHVTKELIPFDGLMVHRILVECPHWPEHGGNVIFGWELPPRPTGWPVWHIEIRKEPVGNTPGELFIEPSIGMHLTKRHTPDCHLGPGVFPFVWGQGEWTP